jgi:hypothetical protein
VLAKRHYIILLTDYYGWELGVINRGAHVVRSAQTCFEGGNPIKDAVVVNCRNGINISKLGRSGRVSSA